MASASSLRRPQHPTFDYTSKPASIKDVWTGFGITSESEKKALSRATERAIQDLRPDYNENKLVGVRNEAKRNEILNALYESLPLLSNAPPNWKTQALNQMQTAAISRLNRREKGPLQEERKENSSYKQGQGRSRRMATIEDKSEDEDEDKSEDDDKEERRASKHTPHRLKRNASDDRLEYQKRARTGSRITPQYREQEAYSKHILSTFTFYTVEFGSLGMDVIELAGGTLVNDEGCIQWTKLTEQATIYSEHGTGFNYVGMLYLSPREKQHQPIKSQCALDTALASVPSGKPLVVTTTAVSKIVPIETQGPQSFDRTIIDSSGRSENSALTLSEAAMRAPPETQRVTPESQRPVAKPKLVHNSQHSANFTTTPQNHYLGVPDSKSRKDTLSSSSCSNPDLNPYNKKHSNPSDNEDLDPSNNKDLGASNSGDLGASNSEDLGLLNNEDLGASNSEDLGLLNNEDLGPSNSEDPDPDPSNDGYSDAKENKLLPSAKDTPDNDASDDDADDGASDDDDFQAGDPTGGIENEEDEEEGTEGEIEDDKPTIAAARDAANAWAKANSQRTKTAHIKAQKTELSLWERAAQTFNMQITELQVSPGCIRVPVPTSLGYNPEFQAMPHQLVGGVEVYINAIGPRGVVMLGDDMGLGKTLTMCLAWDLNWRSVAAIHGATTQPGVPLLHSPFNFPTLDKGRLHGILPKIGATIVIASSQGLDSWPRSWHQLFTKSSIHNAESKWMPKMVMLHPEAAKLTKLFGGESNRLFTTLSREEWAEILPLPDWDNARQSYDDAHLDATLDSWEGESTWPGHAEATTTMPSPTSTRYIIVTTWGVWRKRVRAEFNSAVKKAHKQYKETQAQLGKLANNATAKRARMRRELNQIKAKWMATESPARDGRGFTQACRMGRVMLPDGTTKVVRMVVDLIYAAMVAVDEWHNTSSAETIAYSQIIAPTIKGCARSRPPGIVGITGTALANGIGLALNFAELIRVVSDRTSDDEGIQCMREFADQDFPAAWKMLQNAFATYHNDRRKAIGSAERETRLQDKLKVKEIQDLLKGFACLLEFFFIARDYTSLTPWGTEINPVKGNLHIEHTAILHEPKWFERIQQAEGDVLAAVNKTYKEALLEWKESGEHTEKPSKMTLATADPNAYLIARLVSIYPNLLRAIEAWEGRYPDKPPVFGDSGRCLGGDNEVVQLAIRSEKSIRASFIWDIAKEACKGSAKMEHVLKSIRELQGEKTVVEHPNSTRAREGGKIEYRSKYLLVTGNRLARAIAWSFLVQTFGEKHVRMAARAKDRGGTIQEWQHFYNEKDDQVEDDVYILVAALGAVCQSMNLIEGHVLEGLEPPGNNATRKQAEKRQFRVGQTHSDVWVRWLITKALDHGPKTIDERISQENLMKTRFGEIVENTTTEGATKQTPINIDGD